MADQLYKNAKVTETPYTEDDMLSEDDFALDETEALSENADDTEAETEAFWPQFVLDTKIRCDIMETAKRLTG